MSDWIAIQDRATNAGTWYWAAFGIFVAILLVLDLFVLNRRHEALTTRKAFMQTLLWVSMAFAVFMFVTLQFGTESGVEFGAAYVLEWTLSIDNLFVMALFLKSFRVPREYQHTVLFWGIFGALVMRLGFVLVGIEAVQRFDIAIPIFGLFLVYSAISMVRKTEQVEVERMRSYRFFKRILPMTHEYSGASFVIRRAGQILVTPLLACLAMIESADLMFAIDSIPAVLAVTQDPFIAFTSNAMAVLGLRSLYFLLDGFQEKFTRLDNGIAAILAFVGIKMLLSTELEFLPQFHIPTGVSLLFIAGAIGVSMWASRRWPEQSK